MMQLNELISEKLKTIRREKKMGVYTLCSKATVSYETYRGIRNNKNKDIYVRTLLILLRALDVTPGEFFSDPRFADGELIVDFK